MTKELIFATHNANKLAEVQSLLPSHFTCVGLSEKNCPDIPETGLTLKQNALIKAEFVYQLYRKDCLADDSGLEVLALKGAPGVFSARYAGKAANSEANISKLLSNLQGISNRTAKLRTVIVLIQEGKQHVFEGSISGSIGFAPTGTGGFGYDSIFLPEGHQLSFAQMSAEMKNRMSHRASAIKKMLKMLDKPR